MVISKEEFKTIISGEKKAAKNNRIVGLKTTSSETQHLFKAPSISQPYYQNNFLPDIYDGQKAAVCFETSPEANLILTRGVHGRN